MWQNSTVDIIRNATYKHLLHVNILKTLTTFVSDW